MPEGIEQPTAHYRSYNPKHNVQQHTLSGFVNHFASNETSDQTKRNPRQNRHVHLLIYSGIYSGAVPRSRAVIYERT
jgi:hypothetical protein